MSRHTPTPLNELEEAAQGHDLFRAPGAELQHDEARDIASASGWLPADVVYDWPTAETGRRIVDRRQGLYDAMRALETSVARASGQSDWIDIVVEALAALQTELQRHVTEIEASGGLFSEVLDRAPNLAGDVAALRGDHDELTRDLAMTRDAITRHAPAPEIRRHVLRILGRLAIHRQRGAELLFDTYNVDLAAAN